MCSTARSRPATHPDHFLIHSIRARRCASISHPAGPVSRSAGPTTGRMLLDRPSPNDRSPACPGRRARTVDRGDPDPGGRQEPARGLLGDARGGVRQRRPIRSHPREGDAPGARWSGRRPGVQGGPVQHRRTGSAAARRGLLGLHRLQLLDAGRHPHPPRHVRRWAGRLPAGHAGGGAQGLPRDPRGDQHHHVELRGRQLHRLVGQS